MVQRRESVPGGRPALSDGSEPHRPLASGGGAGGWPPPPPPSLPRPLPGGLPAVLWWALLAAAAAATVFVLRGVLLPLVLGALLAYLLAPLVARLHRMGLPRPWAILSSYAIVCVAVGAFVWMALPDLVGELQRLATTVPGLVSRIEAHVAAVRAGYRRLPLPSSLRGAADGALMRAQRGAEGAIRQALAGLLGGFHVLVALVLAPVLTYYTLADLPRIKSQFARLLPPEARHPVMACLSDLDGVLSGYIRGELVTAIAVGVLATLACVLLRLHFAFTLGLLAMLGELIPYLGPVLGAIPALGVAALQGGLPLTLEVAVAYLAIQQIESVLLAPRIVGGSVSLHPLTTIVALLVGERLGGLAGLFLAVPAAACLRVLGIHAVRALTAMRAPRRLT